jgi:hypothetical protein
MEMLVSLAIMTIIFLGLQSAAMLAGKTAPDGRDSRSATVNASRALDMISNDLRWATSILSSTPTAVQFTVPDRDGDGNAETIRYAWSGIPGDPLTRQQNGGAAVAILAKVQDFQLSYDKRASSVSGAPGQGAEILLASADGTSGLGDEAITATNWTGQFFLPQLPAGTTGWKITRVKFRAKVYGMPTGTTYVQIRTASCGLPDSTVLDQAVMLESNLTSGYTWQEFCFTAVPNLSPNTGACLVFQWVSGITSCDVEHCAATGSTGGLVSTNNGGSSWAGSTNQDVRCYIYGTATTPGGPVVQYALTNVRCSVRTGQDSSSYAHASIRVLNQPQVAGP